MGVRKGRRKSKARRRGHTPAGSALGSVEVHAALKVR